MKRCRWRRAWRARHRSISAKLLRHRAQSEGLHCMMISAEYPDSKVCIIGRGYVGLTLAVAMADVGFQVVGVEKAPAVLQHLRQHRAHFAEVGLDAKLSRQMASGRLTVTDRIEATDCTAYIVTVGTPVDDSHQTKLD